MIDGITVSRTNRTFGTATIRMDWIVCVKEKSIGVSQAAVGVEGSASKVRRLIMADDKLQNAHGKRLVRFSQEAWRQSRVKMHTAQHEDLPD